MGILQQQQQHQNRFCIVYHLLTRIYNIFNIYIITITIVLATIETIFVYASLDFTLVLLFRFWSAIQAIDNCRIFEHVIFSVVVSLHESIYSYILPVPCLLLYFAIACLPIICLDFLAPILYILNIILHFVPI